MRDDSRRISEIIAENLDVWLLDQPSRLSVMSYEMRSHL